MGFAGVVLCLVGLWPYLLGNYRVLGMSVKTWGVVWSLTLGIFGYFTVFLGMALMAADDWKIVPALGAFWLVLGVINVIAIWIKGHNTLDA